MPVIASLYKKLKNEPYWLVSILITGLLIALRQVGGLQSLELIVLDRMTRLKGDRGPDPRILVVEVTEEDIREQGEWPLPDQKIADLIKQIQSNSPRSIGVAT